MLSNLNRSVSDQTPTVQVLPDLEFARYSAVDVHTDSSGSVDVTMMVVFDEVAARYMVDSLTAYRRGPSASVDGASLRTIPVQELLQLLEWNVRISGTGESMPTELPRDLVQSIKAAGPSDPDSLRWLARVYVAAHAFHRPPAKAVQQQLDMPAPTASVWIRRARDRGLIPASIGAAEFMSDEDYKLAKLQLRGFADG